MKYRKLPSKRPFQPDLSNRLTCRNSWIALWRTSEFQGVLKPSIYSLCWHCLWVRPVRISRFAFLWMPCSILSKYRSGSSWFSSWSWLVSCFTRYIRLALDRSIFSRWRTPAWQCSRCSSDDSWVSSIETFTGLTLQGLSWSLYPSFSWNSSFSPFSWQLFRTSTTRRCSVRIWRRI